MLQYLAIRVAAARNGLVVHSPQRDTVGPLILDAVASVDSIEVNPSSERRERILRVAITHFSTAPYDDVSTVAIAQEAEVNRGWLHHEFGSKRALYAEVLRRVIKTPRLPSAETAETPEALEGILTAGMTHWLDDVEAHPAAYLAAQRVASGLTADPELQDLVDRWRERTIDNALRATRVEDLNDPSARAVAAAFAGLFGEVVVEWLGRGRLSREQAEVLLIRMAMSAAETLPAVRAARGA